VSDSRIYDYKEHSYYVGENVSHLPSDNRIDITEYKNLEYYAPLLLHHAITILSEIPDVIVAGLSKAQINNSGYFKEAIQSFKINDIQYNFDKVFIIPQGAGAKLTIDKYGNHFPVEQDEFLGTSTYVGCDIGFSTLDMFLVTKGKTSPALFEGIEKEGIMKIATEVAKEVYTKHGRKIGLHEAKEILDTGVFKLRGQKHSYKDFVDEVKKEYIKNLLKLIEAKYGKILDKCDFVSITGGGSALFNSTTDGFIRIPSANHEYYNAVGQYLYGLNKV